MRAKTSSQRFCEHLKAEGECIIWTGQRTRYGYGVIAIESGKGGRKMAAHKYSWEKAIGPVPAGLELDHLCRNKLCVNVRHLEPVTHTENVRRGRRLITHCPEGHPYDEANTSLYHSPTGVHRFCKACKRNWWHERKVKI